MRTHETYEDVLAVFKAQGSNLITLAALQEWTFLIDDYRTPEGDRYPCLGLANGVRWFYDKDRRPPATSGRGIMKSQAPAGRRRTMVGELDAPNLVLFEGERDWLTAISIGVRGAVCAGGVLNLDEGQVLTLASKTQVTFFFDNDEAGDDAARAIAAKLASAGCHDVRTCTAPTAGQDFSDWIEAYDGDQPLGHFGTLLIKNGLRMTRKEARKVEREAKRKDEKTKPVVSDEFVVPGGDPVALIWKPANPERPQDEDAGGRALFARYDSARSRDAGFLIVDELDKFEQDNTGEIYGPPHLRDGKPPIVPLSGEILSTRVMVVPSGAKSHGTSEGLWDDVYDLIDRHFVVRDRRFLAVATAYVFMTYRWRDAGFESLPYLHPVGESGSGKSRIATIMRELGYRTVFVSGMRAAHLYRILDHLGGHATVVFEEFNLRSMRREDRGEFTDLLNAGNQRGRRVPRMGGPQFSDMKFHRLLSPKIIPALQEFEEPGLLRRCFTTRLGDVSEADIPSEKWFPELPNSFYQQADELRRRLLGWRFEVRGKEYGTDLPDPARSLRGEAPLKVVQNASPLLRMVPPNRPEELAAILEMAKEMHDGYRRAIDESLPSRALAAAANVEPGANIVALPRVLAHLNAEDPYARLEIRTVRQAYRDASLKPRRTSFDGEKGVWVIDKDDAFYAAARRYGLNLRPDADSTEKPAEIM